MKLGLGNDPNTFKSLLVQSIDVVLVLALTYMVLVIIGERRTLWMVRGFIVLMFASALSQWAQLRLLSFALNSLVVGAAVSMAVILQSEFRRFLEQLGRGQISQMFRGDSRVFPEADNTIDEMVQAVKQLSQNRTGALIIVETESPIDERDFSVPGVKLNAEISKELLQTIFQPKTLLHDGAVLVRANRVVSAGVILPLSERIASRQLGTRHRAAMGITEKVQKCLCVVVSEETGSISMAEKGVLNRPLTSNKLKELLEDRLLPFAEERTPTTLPIGNLSRQIGSKGATLIANIFDKNPSASRKKK
ncbi:MAG: diadenylate cyclase CdaA [Cyanobacteriota bacterium]|nr:diadenylate cyclase CdaA [Cyanobacteriota bacterium]